MSERLLTIKDLWIERREANGSPILRGINLYIEKGEKVGLVGESGCGKTLTALAILGLLPEEVRITRGEIILWERGKSIALHELPPRSPSWLRIRGRKISMIFQEPSAYLNPTLSIGIQVMEPLIYHFPDKSRAELKKMAMEIMEKVGLPYPEKIFSLYPHELSGGMQQRALIAMSLVLHPSLLIADEPTTSLDVTIQAHILRLLDNLAENLSMSLLLITHDLSIISQMVDRVYVMYQGMFLEWGDKKSLIDAPLHPYLETLIVSIPRVEKTPRDQGVKVTPSSLPEEISLLTGCPFYPRCRKSLPPCPSELPPAREVSPHHWVRCWIYEKDN